jgi:hypothetical protein
VWSDVSASVGLFVPLIQLSVLAMWSTLIPDEGAAQDLKHDH